VGTRLGVTPDRSHLLIGVHGLVNVLRSARWNVGYAPEVVPLLVVSNNPTYRYEPDGTPTILSRGPVAGFAVSPIGVEGQRTLASRWRVYGAGAAGCVWFSRETPSAYSRAFNYTFELGGGVEWQYGRQRAVRIGYKFHHLSNAYTAPNNPGLDGAVFLVGFGRSYGK
jgi:hypothetical protein